MIKKISKLKNFGIFQEFSWISELPEFQRFNLIYAWNRSGKTTISRVFSSLEKSSLYDIDKFRQYPEGGEFEIKTLDGTVIKSTDIATNGLLVKVFNQDFIDDNISFNPIDSCKPIIYISTEDIESKKKLEELKIDKVGLTKALELVKKDKISKEEIKNMFLTGLGREIANNLFDKSYNKTKVENKINSVGVNNFSDKELTDDEKKKYELISKSEPGKEQLIFSEIPVVNYNFLFQRIKGLLDKKIVSELLERLKDPDDRDGGLDEELNNWVKQGFDIHKSKNQFKKCFFCENDLGNNLFDSLARHFSKDYEDLQNSIEFLIIEIKKEKQIVIPEKNIELSSDMKDTYEIYTKKYNEVIKELNDWLWNAEMWLEQKYKNPFDPDIPEMVDVPKNYSDLLNLIIKELNTVIQNHNKRIIHHDVEVKAAREKLELHSICIALSKQNYIKMGTDLQDVELLEKEAFELVRVNNESILKLEEKVSDIGEAIIKINEYLEEFFGKDEIKLQLDDDKKGYIIKRNGKEAKNLSEGEKTAIAFSYFIVKTKEKGFKINDSIIFIDDPISSFDSNFIYHCFSLISNHFKEAGQLFISTHNFQLFNLVKEWFLQKNSKVRKENDKLEAKGETKKTIPCEFYMVENFLEVSIRKAKIIKLDKTLLSFKSEYHFLFDRLKKFSDAPSNEYDEYYTIGNMARRFFDIFADFKIPISSDQKSKMDILIGIINETKEVVSSIEASKAYKLVNEFSHNSTPTSTIEHKDKNEIKNAVKIILKIVQASDPRHFDYLIR